MVAEKNAVMSVTLIPTYFCNMRCKYCYRSETGFDKKIMSDDTLEKVFRMVIPEYSKVQFLWHGGEPLIVGLDFYKKAISLQKQYATINNTEVRNNVQTNCTLVTPEFAKFLHENNFGCGTSFDGRNHDYLRGNKDDFLKGYRELLSHGMSVGAISVVSGVNVDRLIETYESFKEEGIQNLQLNPLVEEGFAKKNEVLKLDIKKYTEKMIDFFEYWISDKDGISVEPFFSNIRTIKENKDTSCSNTSCHGKWMCVDPSGELELCNMCYEDSFYYGNIHNFSTIDEVFNSDGFKKMLVYSKCQGEKCIGSCELYKYCQGGRINGELRNRKTDDGVSFTCYINKKLLGHIIRKVNDFYYAMDDHMDLNPFFKQAMGLTK
ncbi:MAG: radical SAM protein [Methanomassiliicoccaceae archaeon]|nr:radical SAM protein [Methanomassiliicoccaceae archaeon]